MSHVNSGRPAPSECGPYYGKYIDLVPGDDIVSALDHGLTDALFLLRSVSAGQADHRYAPGKWSLKEVIGHVLDFERIFSYRALQLARGSQTPLPGCDQDELMKESDFSVYPIEDLSKEFEHVRRANISLFRHFKKDAWDRRGMVSEQDVTVRALAYVVAGHAMHHMEVVRTKYL